MVKMEPVDVSTSTPLSLLSEDVSVVNVDGSSADGPGNMVDDIVSGDEEMDAEDELEDEDDSYVLHPGLLCRLCANTVTNPIYIFSENGKDLELAAKINICLPITVSIYLYFVNVTGLYQNLGYMLKTHDSMPSCKTNLVYENINLAIDFVLTYLRIFSNNQVENKSKLQ